MSPLSSAEYKKVGCEIFIYIAHLEKQYHVVLIRKPQENKTFMKELSHHFTLTLPSCGVVESRVLRVRESIGLPGRKQRARMEPVTSARITVPPDATDAHTFSTTSTYSCDKY